MRPALHLRACIQQRVHLLFASILVERFVDGNHWCTATRAHTFNFFEGESAIISLLVVAYAETILSMCIECFAPSQHATDVGAYLHMVPAHGFFEVHGVEGSHT